MIPGIEHTYKSDKSRTTYIMRVENGKAYLMAEGEMSTNPNVIKECARVRREPYDVSTVDWMARQLSHTY